MESTVSPIPGPGHPPARTPGWQGWLAGLCLILAGWAAYGNSLQGVYVMDDERTIQDNTSFQHGWGAAWSPPDDGGPVTGRPLVNFSYALSYELSGLAPWGYHVGNVVIHLLAALTLFGLVRRTLSRPDLAERYGPSALWLSLGVALVWMLHPLQTESVTYISQRAEALMGLFYLLTLYCLARSAQSDSAWFWQILTVGACLLGMLCKEVMVTAPLMALLYDRTFLAGSFAKAWRRRWTLYFALACTWLPLALLVYESGSRGKSAGYGLGVAWWKYSWVQLRVVVHYLQLSMWPHPLVLNYGDNVPTPDAAIILDALIVAVLVAGTLYALWRKPPLGFAGAWVFAILAPSSSIVPIVTEPAAEHRMYLPLAGIVVIAVFGLWAIGRKWTRALLLIWAVALGAATIERNQDFQSAVTLWQDNAAKLPELAVLHKNLAVALANAGRAEEALQEDETSLRLNPRDFSTEYNLGLHLAHVGRLDEALGHFQRAADMDPDYNEACTQVGITLLKLNRVPEAIVEFQKVLHITPDSPEGQMNLGHAYNSAGQFETALRYYQHAELREPDSPDVHYGLGSTFILLGRLDEAIRECETSVRLRPNNPEAQYQLGLAFSKAGRVAEAIKQYQIALALAPNFAVARNALLNAQRRLQNQPVLPAP